MERNRFLLVHVEIFDVHDSSLGILALSSYLFPDAAASIVTTCDAILLESMIHKVLVKKRGIAEMRPDINRCWKNVVKLKS